MLLLMRKAIRSKIKMALLVNENIGKKKFSKQGIQEHVKAQKKCRLFGNV